MTNPSATDCIFCKPDDLTYKYMLYETPLFRVICDAHPLMEGHILIIPKEHVSCVGAYSEAQLNEFLSIYEKTSRFISASYQKVSTFEHGIFGQTVFHSHVHLMPFHGEPDVIVPEGNQYLKPNANFHDLKGELDRESGYLYFSINNDAWLVDAQLREPRFFRDRFARALNVTDRMDWKNAQSNPQLMDTFEQENQNVLDKWHSRAT